jgi:hypothetical protein
MYRLAPKFIFFKENLSQVIQKSSHDFDFFGNLKKSQILGQQKSNETFSKFF